MTRRLTKLTLLLVVVGALALAGCGGDDGGLSMEDMARLDAIDKKADDATATADDAKKTADDATAMDDDDPDALTADQAVMATWEAIFTPAVEKSFAAMVGSDPTIASIQLAIETLAKRYMVDLPGDNRATLQAMLITHFANADPTPSTALAYFQMLRTSGFLPANQMRATMTLTDSTTAHQYEMTFAPSVEAMFAEKVGANPTQEKIRMVIQEIATMYGVTVPTTAALQASIQAYFTANQTTGTALGFFKEYRTAGFLPATASRAADVIARRAPGMATSGGPGSDDGEEEEMPMSDMTMVSYIDDIIAMGDIEETVMGDLSTSAKDYATSGLLSETKPAAARYGDNIRTFESLISKDGFAEVTADARVWGAWGKYNAFGSIVHSANQGMVESFSIGVEAEAPTGSKGGSVYWTGAFVGNHMKMLGAAAIPADGDTAAVAASPDYLAAGTAVNGRVRLDVNFSEAAGVAETMDATFDNFSNKSLDDASHTIAGISIKGGGSFEGMAPGSLGAGVEVVTGHGALVDGTYTPFEDGQTFADSSIEGQFYGPDGMEAGGVVKLVNGFTGDDEPMQIYVTDATTRFPNSYYITGAFGAERN